jgi:peptidoglycan/xylan/chitin deacetylase (PgdA/CDA1 family)
MDDVLRFTKPLRAEDSPALNNGTRYVAVTLDDGFRSIISNALPVLRERKIPATVFVPSGNLGKPPAWLSQSSHQDSGEFVMTAEELLHVNEDPLISIGSHCVSHPNLLSLSPESAATEILESKRDLETILKQEITLLAFPYGAFSSSHTALAKEGGYKRAFSGLADLTDNVSSYVMGRVRVDPKDWTIEFRLKLLDCYRWHPLASSLKRRIKSFVS